MRDEIKKQEERESEPTSAVSEQELGNVVGGACSGKHIKDVTIEMMRASGDPPPPPPPPPTT